jgi:Domain of unknown function (DUF4864)
MNIRARISLVLLFIASCGTAAMLTIYLQARAERSVKPADLYAVVNEQLGDLRRENFPAAYGQASHEIQERFTVEQFATMVRADYPGFLQVNQAEYGPVEARGNHAAIRVYLIGRDGQVMPCLYQLVREKDAWRIDGTRLLHAWPASARMAGTML